jgi:hypothetical protein
MGRGYSLAWHEILTYASSQYRKSYAIIMENNRKNGVFGCILTDTVPFVL